MCRALISIKEEVVMKHAIAITLYCITTYACAMEKETTSFMATYQKKRTIAEALDSGVPQKKKKFPMKALNAFKAAINIKDINGAHRILKDNNYCPKYISLAEAVRHDDLPDFIYWLTGQNDMHTHENNCITALHTASALGNYFFMKLLLELGVPLDAENSAGWTALDYAVYHNRPEGVCLLLAHGARENKPNMHGCTPLYYLIELFSRGRRFPYTATMNLITTFLTHAPWNERPPLMVRPKKGSMQFLEESNDQVLYANINQEASKARYKTGLLSLKRACALLPLVLKYKIFSYMPEDVHTEKIFRALFPLIEKNNHGLAQLVEISPMAWFISLSRSKRLACTRVSREHEQFLERVVPLIAAYRIRRSYELLSPLGSEHQNCIMKCIQSLEGDQQQLILDVITQELLT